jgi:hypothetical protein
VIVYLEQAELKELLTTVLRGRPSTFVVDGIVVATEARGVLVVRARVQPTTGLSPGFLETRFCEFGQETLASALEKLREHCEAATEYDKTYRARA